MAVSVRLSQTTFDAGKPVEMFDARTGATIVRTVYAVAADGRFLFNVPVVERTASPITVILNWAWPRK